MATKDFRTKTMFLPRPSVIKKDGYWPVALDIGYSGLKGISPNCTFCFPSFAKKIAQDDIILGKPEEDDILFRDSDTGDLYVVGRRSQAMLSAQASEENASLYGRNRYFSTVFQVVAKTGLGLALGRNKHGVPDGKKVLLQTGLPPKYLREDTPLLKEALSGIHRFDLKVGDSDWNHYEITLSPEDIRVMQQPMGTLLSISSTNDGRPTADAKKLFQSKVLVLDPGFGTLDCCYIKERTIHLEDCLTFDNLGMRRVLQDTCDELRKQYDVSMEVPAIQPYLESGFVKSFNRRERKSVSIPFEEILLRQSQKICLETLHKLEEIYNYFWELDYLVITGGLGAAWNPFVREYLKGMETLQILSGTRNDDLPYIFANVRGYYLFLANTL